MLIERSDIKRKIGFFQRLVSAKMAFSGQPSQLLNLFQKFMPMYGEPPKRSTKEWEDLYNKNPRMNPIHQIASDVACSLYGIYKNTDEKKEKKLKNNPVENLLKNPNPNLTITEYFLFYITQVYLMLPSGEAFWIKERNKLGQVTELWPVPPSWVLAIPSIVQPFFSIYPQGNMQVSPIYVPQMDIVYFKKPNIINPYLRGSGRAEGIGDELETDEYMAKYQKRYFFNDAIPAMVGMMPGADETVIDRTEEMWQQKYGGVQNKHKVAWLNWDAKFQLLKETTKDMDFIESRKYLRDSSNQHFSIPPELFGILENSNRSTIDAAYYLYTKNVLRKELKFIDDTLNNQLIPDFANDICLQHDNVVPEDEEFKLKKASEGLKNGGISVDEWRISNGWQPLPNGLGQILYTPLNMMPTPLSSKAIVVNLQPTASAQETLPKEKPTKSIENKGKVLSEEQKKRIWIIMDKSATKNERSFINALKKYFQAQQDKINAKLFKSIKISADDIDWDEEDKELLKTLKALWSISLEEGFNVSNDAFSFGLNFDVVNPLFFEWINKYGLQRAKTINETSRTQLNATLAEGIELGESIPKLADRVANVYDNAKGYRSTLIARTETITTVNSGSFITYKQAGIKQKEWLAQIDKRTRDTHRDPPNGINGEIVDIDQPFSNGVMVPCEPNCRCTILPVFQDNE